MKKSRGFMYLAKRRCGKVAAMCWDDPGYEKDTAKAVGDYVKRGLAVTRIEVFVDDPMPETICEPGETCECLKKT